MVEYIEFVLNHCGYNLTFIQYSIEIASVFDQVRLLRPLNQDFVFWVAGLYLYYYTLLNELDRQPMTRQYSGSIRPLLFNTGNIHNEHDRKIRVLPFFKTIRWIITNSKAALNITCTMKTNQLIGVYFFIIYSTLHLVAPIQ